MSNEQIAALEAVQNRVLWLATARRSTAPAVPHETHTSGASWPYELLGVGYSLLRIALIGYAHRRQSAVEAAVRRGERAPPEHRVVAALTAVGIVLGAATIAVVLFAGT